MEAESREYLHKVLDELIDETDDLRAKQPLPVNALVMVTNRDPLENLDASDMEAASRSFNRGIRFLRDVLGEPVRNGALFRRARTPEQQRNLLIRWLMAIMPILPEQLGYGSEFEATSLTVWDVTDALNALGAGEIQPIFRARTDRNRRANRWTLAKRKLEALAWKKRLLALGRSEKQANHELTMSFGEQWDTIRKWKGQCEAILGKLRVDASLSRAGGAHDPHIHGRQGLLRSTKPDVAANLQYDGQAYKSELQKSADLSRSPAKAGPEA